MGKGKRKKTAARKIKHKSSAAKKLKIKSSAAIIATQYFCGAYDHRSFAV
jgi:hypothetical protein